MGSELGHCDRQVCRGVTHRSEVGCSVFSFILEIVTFLTQGKLGGVLLHASIVLICSHISCSSVRFLALHDYAVIVSLGFPLHVEAIASVKLHR